MHQDPYAILHALLRAEAVRNGRNEQSHRPEQREESGADKPDPTPPAQGDRA